MNSPKKYPVYHWRFWTSYFVHMRPYLLFISGIAGATGLAVAVPQPLTGFAPVAAFLVFFLSYGFGQALTDCFQTDTDRISAPYRPLSRGVIAPRTVAVVSVTGLLAGVGLLIYFNPWNALFGLLAVIGLATYTKFKRDYWFAGPFYNAWIVALLPVMGLLTLKEDGLSALNDDNLWIVVALSFFAYANFVLIGYLKDITADRETGYHTFPVVFGWDRSVWAGDAFALAGTLLSASLAFANIQSIVVWTVGTVVAVAGQAFAHLTKNKTEENAAFPIAATVRSFILWHLAVILAFRPALWPFALGYYVLFEIVLWLRPERAQI